MKKVLKKIGEGKTKILYDVSEYKILIKNKSTLTAGDGEKKDVLEDKNIFSNETTCNCFRLLKEKGIPTHFIEKVSPDSFFARKVDMIPIELVARRIATGSYLRRHPETVEGTIFADIIIEFFFKDDSLHDPLMIWHEKEKIFKLYNAKDQTKFLKNLPESILIPSNMRGIKHLSNITRRVFTVLEDAWKKQNVALVDMKIECGIDTETNNIIVADVIDNDSWRIWPAGDKKNMKDKQVFRDNEMTPGIRKKLKKNYAWVAEATKKFIKIA